MFGISNNVRSRVVRVCTPELFHQVVHSPLVGRICAEIADALEAMRRGEMAPEDFDTLKSERKKQLPIFTPHATFPGGRRLNSDAVPSGLSMYDVDHIPAPREFFREHVAARVRELGIVLAHVTPSTEGLRLFFVIPPGMGLEEAQRWMSHQLDDGTYDQCVKDYARSSFAVPADYILYLDEAELFREREVQKAKSHEEADIGSISSARNPAGNSVDELSFKGIPYADLIARWFRLTGGEPVAGERNDRLHRLASHLRYITDNDESLLLRIMPRYGLDEEEMRALIHSACTSKFCSMPRLMKDVLRQEEQERMHTETEVHSGKSVPPPMPRKLPPLIRLLVSRTPEIYRPAVAHAVFPSLAAHLWKVRFRYIDNVEHEATLMNVLMAGTGAGKDCISEPINRIMADIRLRDEENLRREREWKKEVNSKGANKDKRQRPEGLVIQEIDADMTNPAFVMRTAEAEGHFLYTKLNEIDQFDALRGGEASSSRLCVWRSIRATVTGRRVWARRV